MKRISTITPETAREILEKVHFFDRFKSEEKETLTGFHSHFFLAKKHEYIIHQGDLDTSFYILLTGSVKVKRQESTQVLADLKPGDIFGEVSFLTERPRTSSVIATSQSIVFEIDKATMKHMAISIREKLKDNIIHILVNRLDHMNQRFVQTRSISS